MDIIVLAGGYAERLWPLTKNYPKALLPIAGRPVLQYLIDNLSHISQIDSFTICVDEPFNDQFEKLKKQLTINGTIRPQIAKHSLNNDGTLTGALAKLHEIWREKARYGVKGKEFLVVGGDNLFGFQLADFAKFFRKSHDSNCNAIHRLPYSVDASQFGVPEITRSGALTNVIEKPINSRVRTVSTACYCLTREAIDYLGEYLEAKNPDNLGQFLGWLAHKTKVESYVFDQPWQDIGTREGLLQANSLILGSQNLISSPHFEDGTVTIDQPIYFGKGVKVTNSWIGPYVYLGSNVSVTGSRIKNCIAYDNSVIRNCNLENSVVGSASVVEGKVNNTVAGSNSSILAEENSRAILS